MGHSPGANWILTPYDPKGKPLDVILNDKTYMSIETSRLDRIEEKLDRVVETLQMLARIDERQDSLEQRINRHELRLDGIEDDQQETAEAMAKSQGRGMLLERGAWIVFAAAVSVSAQIF